MKKLKKFLEIKGKNGCNSHNIKAKNDFRKFWIFS